MVQTLLAVCGLAIVMLLALSMQKSTVSVETAKVDSEIETLAGQAALDVLAHIAARPFDEQTAAGAVASPSDLTAAADFPTGLTFAAATDVDDFHRMATYTHASGTPGLEYLVDAEVAYVSESAAPSATPTYQKQVTVTVRHDALPAPVIIERIVSWP